MDRPGQSAWMSFLDWIQRPQQAVMATAHGNLAGAGRQLEDFLLGPVDAIPGIDVAQRHTAADEYSTGSRVGDMAASVALNPLTYLPMSPTVRRAVTQAGTKAVRALPRSVRSSVGWEQLDPKVADAIQRARGAEEVTTQAGMGHWRKILNDLPIGPDEDKALHDAIQNIAFDEKGVAKRLLVDGSKIMPGASLDERAAVIKSRIRAWKAQNPGAPIDEVKLDKIVDAYVPFSEAQRLEGVANGVFAPGQAQEDYLKRIYTGLEGGSSGARARELKSPEEVVAFQKLFPEVGMHRSFTKSVLERIEGQGRLMKRAQLMREIGIDPLAAHAAGDVSEQAYDDLIKQHLATFAGAGDDTFNRLRYELGREPYQGDAVARGMQAMKKYFTPAAVYGVGPFVRLGAIVRNQLSGYMQMMTEPEGRAALMRDPLQGFRNLWGAVDDGIRRNFGKGRWTTGELTEAFDAMEAAAAKSGGIGDDMIRELASTKPEIAEAVKNGVLSGFVTSERLANTVLRNPESLNLKYWMVPGHPGADVGAAMFQGLENRMRLGTYLDMTRNGGVSPKAAAAKVRDIFLDYAPSSQGNRLLRTWFPFMQFITQSMRQQGKFFATTPAALTGTAALFQQQGDIPGWAEQQAHLPLPGGGVLAGGGSPAEAFNVIPDLSSFGAAKASLASGIGSALNPLPKTAIQAATGVDLFTGRPWDPRLPFADYSKPRTAADTLYGLVAETGLAQPVTGPVAQAESISRRPAAGALRYLTGLNPVQADPLKAEAEDLQKQLEADPRVRTRQWLQPVAREPDVVSALKRLQEVRKELAAKVAQAQQGVPAAPVSPPATMR
jgi:hypothetical protein